MDQELEKWRDVWDKAQAAMKARPPEKPSEGPITAAPQPQTPTAQQGKPATSENKGGSGLIKG